MKSSPPIYTPTMTLTTITTIVSRVTSALDGQVTLTNSSLVSIKNLKGDAIKIQSSIQDDTLRLYQISV
jgi:hypothetical protein